MRIFGIHLWGKKRPVKHAFNFRLIIKPFGQKLEIKGTALMPQENYTEARNELIKELDRCLEKPDVAITNTFLFKRQKSWLKKQKV